jgi:hypothetical protein
MRELSRITSHRFCFYAPPSSIPLVPARTKVYTGKRQEARWWRTLAKVPKGDVASTIPTFARVPEQSRGKKHLACNDKVKYNKGIIREEIMTERTLLSTERDAGGAPISRAYLRLSFHIERLVPGFIDAYFGPPEWKTDAEAEGDIPPADLRRDAEALLHDIASIADELRREWLTKQVTAMIATLRRTEGETLPFDEELRLVYDIHPQWTDERVFEDALRQISDLLPGTESLADRLEAWDAQFDVPKEKLLPLFTACRDEARRRTRRLFALPEGEEIVLQIVEQQPWSAYNWYLGDYRSRVDVNTDLPVRANSMLELMTHEGYPGHHTEHAIKEKLLYREQGHAEACVQLINAPECVISEGLADLAREIIFTELELEAWLRDTFYPLTGIAVSVSRDRSIANARRQLRALSGNAAFLLHRDGASEQAVVDYLQRYGARTEKQARQSYRFIANPLFRSYVFNYHYGYSLLSRYIAIGGRATGDRVARFQTLLEQPLTPSLIEQRIAQSSKGGQVG